MKNRLTLLCGIFFIAISTLLAAYFYPQMPQEMAVHWNLQGEANGSMPRFCALLVFPALMALMLALAFILPWLDPFRKNIEKFRNWYNAFWLVLIAFSFYLFVLTIVWNTGTHFNFIQVLIPAIALLWAAVGALLKNVKRNWFMGIRTPWTLSSDTIWEKTHRLGSTLFYATAAISLGGLLFPKMAVLFMLAPLVATAIITVVYSLILFQLEKK